MSRLMVRPVLATAWDGLRRRWLALLVVLPLLAAADNLLARRLMNAAHQALGPGPDGHVYRYLAFEAVHDVIRLAVLGGLVCGFLLRDAPSAAERAQGAVRGLTRGWGGLLVYGAAAAFPQALGSFMQAAITQMPADAGMAGAGPALSVVQWARLAFLLGLAALLAPLPAVAAAEGRGPARALELTRGARWAAGGLRFGFAVAVFLPLKLATDFLYERFPGPVIYPLAEYRAALCEVLWLVVACAIYRHLAEDVPPEVPEAFD